MIRRWFAAAALAASLTPAWAATSAAYTITAPPRMTHAQSRAAFGPVAALLTRVTGHPFRFRFTRNWLVYMQEVRKNTADVYFDGPAFIGWRAARFQDRAAAALSGKMRLVLVVKRGTALSNPDQLAGESVCAFSPPNLATLVFESLFPNPDRRPYFHIIHNLKSTVSDVLKGTCRAVMVPLQLFTRFNKVHPGALAIAYRVAPLPNQGFSVSSKMPRAIQDKVIAALTSPAGQAATAELRASLGHKRLVRSHTADYVPAEHLLDNMIGFQGT